MQAKRWSKRLLTILASLTMLSLMVLQPSEPAEAAIDWTNKQQRDEWKPLQNPEPSINDRDAFTYKHVCGVDETTMNNMMKNQPYYGDLYKPDYWWRYPRDACELAQALAHITYVPNKEKEAQGIYTYEALFNDRGLANGGNMYTSLPLFFIMWDKNYELNSVRISPISAYAGWGPVAHTIDGLDEPINLNRSNCNSWGKCKLLHNNQEVLKWAYVDPYYGNGNDQDTENFGVFHLTDDTGYGIKNNDPNSYFGYLTTNEWAFDGKWYKPGMQYLKYFHLPNDEYPYRTGEAFARRVGGTFSIEYGTTGGHKQGNKRAKITYELKRKPGVAATKVVNGKTFPNTPFTAAHYKSYDHNQDWRGFDALDLGTPTEEFYEPLKIREFIRTADGGIPNYSEVIKGRKIPEHLINIVHRGDSTVYKELSGPRKSEETCRYEDPYELKYRYKSFIEPTPTNPFGIPSITDPATGEVSKFEPKYDPFNKRSWWETTYRGYKVVLNGDQSKDENGVSSFSMEWVPNADTPFEQYPTSVSIDMPSNPYRIKYDAANLAQARPVIKVKDQKNNLMKAGYPMIVEVTKPDGSKVEYEAKTNDQGQLIAKDGKPLSTITDASGNYTVNVTYYGKKVTIGDKGWGDYKGIATEASPANTPHRDMYKIDNCVKVDRINNAYEVYYPARHIEVQKVDANDKRLMGSRFTVYPDLNGQPDTTAGKSISFMPPDGTMEANGKATNGAWTSRKPLEIDKKYWLVETQAPFGHQLALPIQFTVKENSIVLNNAAKDKNTAIVTGNTATRVTAAEPIFPAGTTVSNNHVIRVRDQEKPVLPASGGHGVVSSTLAGALLIGAGFWFNRRARKA